MTYKPKLFGFYPYRWRTKPIWWKHYHQGVWFWIIWVGPFVFRIVSNKPGRG